MRHKPMRAAEARITLGVIAAHSGDLEQAIAHGRQALAGDRKSLPSLLLCAHELTELLQAKYPNELESTAYLEEVRTLAGR